MPGVRQELDGWGAVWSPVPKLRPGKNAADIALTFEAAVMTREGAVSEVWIVSGDSDFTPLAERLRQDGIRVVVFGPTNTPQPLRDSCSSFVPLNDLENGIQVLPLSAPAPIHRRPSCGERIQSFAHNVIDSLRPDGRGWFHGFVRRIGTHFGFIQVSGEYALPFFAWGVDTPMRIHDLRSGDPVEFKIGRNYKGPIAVHVRKTFALRAA